MTRKKICAAVIAIILSAGMTLPAYAFYDPYRALEEKTRQAVAAAIETGTVPPGTTIYDCAYGKDENGVTIVVQYRDKNGNWIDVVTQKKADNPPAGAAASTNVPTEKVSDEALAEYADEVFRLTNEERVKAGKLPLERSDYLDEAANTRATECASVNSLYVDGTAHTRPDGSRWFTIFGISKNYNYGENAGQGKVTADMQMKSWIKSDGHKENILKDDYTEIGIGCAISEQGEIFAVQVFYRP